MGFETGGQYVISIYFVDDQVITACDEQITCLESYVTSIKIGD